MRVAGVFGWTAAGDLQVSLSPTRDVVEEMSLGVARNIINNMVMKKGCFWLSLKLVGRKCYPGASQVVLVVKNPPANAGDLKRCGSNPWIRKISWRRAWQPTQVFLPGESLGQRNLAGYRPQGDKRLDTTEAT